MQCRSVGMCSDSVWPTSSRRSPEQPHLSDSAQGCASLLALNKKQNSYQCDKRRDRLAHLSGLALLWFTWRPRSCWTTRPVS